jgi:Uma2 family endonuclease
MKIAQHAQISEEEYLRLEAASRFKSEFVSGHIYAMTGASLRHNVIALNMATNLRAHLRGSPCRAFMSDAKLRVAKFNSYYYPDVMVTCDPRYQRVSSGDSMIESPRLIVEVLSTSTEATDRREKLQAYRSLPSLLEYVLVSQESAAIEIHRRQGDIGWQIITLSPGDPVEFSSVELTTDFAALYDESGVDL